MSGEKHTGRAVRLALRLHPGGSALADEMAGVYEQSADDMGPLERAREVFGIAGYGLRLRTGLASAGTAGRLLASAAPFAAGAMAGEALVELATLGLQLRHGTMIFPTSSPFGFWLFKARMVVGLGALVAALCGRWSSARAAALAVVLLEAVAVVGELAGDMRPFDVLLRAFFWDGAQVMWSLLLLAAPPDLLARGAGSWRRVAGALGGILVAGPVMGMEWVVALIAGSSYMVGDYGRPLLAAAELAVCLLAAVALVRRWDAPLVAAVATLPLAVNQAASALFLTLGRGTALPAMIALTVAVVVGLRKWTAVLRRRELLG